MDIALTIIRILLALVFAGAGIGKLTQPIDKLGARMPWVLDFKPGAIRLIGAVEVLAAAGLIASLIFRALMPLGSWAAFGLALVMAGAMATHLRRGEYGGLVANLVLLTLAAFVAYYSRLMGFAG